MAEIYGINYTYLRYVRLIVSVYIQINRRNV